LSNPSAFTESVVEQAAPAWLEGIGWPVRNGTDIAPDGPAAERRDYGQVVLELRKLLQGELRIRRRKNVVQAALLSGEWAFA
jgi:hypothetical protein